MGKKRMGRRRRECGGGRITELLPGANYPCVMTNAVVHGWSLSKARAQGFAGPSGMETEPESGAMDAAMLARIGGGTRAFASERECPPLDILGATTVASGG